MTKPNPISAARSSIVETVAKLEALRKELSALAPDEADAIFNHVGDAIIAVADAATQFELSDEMRAGEGMAALRKLVGQ